ncbi:hypothetical protein AAHE18_17G120800 [Arachis hypogaea]
MPFELTDKVSTFSRDVIDFTFDCIYDLEPLGFEKCITEDDHYKGFESQDPLEEVNLGTHDDVRITYICKDLIDLFRTNLIDLLHEFKDCFAWDYHEMPGLDRSLVEHRLALKPNARPMKQIPRRFAPEINVKIKEEIERLIKAKFIRTAHYVEWVSNIVPVMKKNEKLRVCIDFRDLNNATPKDEYFMPIADMLIDSAAGNEILSFMDDYSGYNQIFIAEDDVAKTAFRCPGALGTYDWVVMPFGNFLGFVVHKKGIAIDKNKADAILALSAPKSKKEVQSFLGKINYLRRFISNLSDRTRVFAPLVIAQTDVVKYMLSFPMLRGRLGKWMLALTEFNLQYVPAKAVKGQVIAYFLVDNSKDLNDQGANIIDIEVNYWKLYFDGSKHKDGTGFGILIILPEGVPSEFLFELKHACSNNVAEYEALILELEILIDKGAIEEFKCNNETLQKYLVIAWEMLTSFQKVSLVLCMDEWEDSDWRKLISQYLKDPNTAVDRKIKLQAMNFVLLANELYKKGIDGSLSRCLGREDHNVALGKVHNGICGAHQAGRKMRWVLCRNHIYWPSMIKDCIDYAKACQECQKHGSIQQIPAAEGWALDLIGLIHPPSSRQHKFILVAIDYFTKWVEAIPLVEAGQTEIIDFIEENIIHRFEIPQTLTSRNINIVTSTPYYAQANGQVEAANKILIGLIKKHIGNRPRTWHETLSQVLWAYQNSPRGSTGTSPYKLVYGHDAVLPLKINLNTLRVSKQNDLPVDDYWNAMFDELNDYNHRISRKSFQTGELVLKVILPIEKKSRFLGKWSHSWEGPFQVIGTYSGNAYQIKDIESGKVISSINGKYLKRFYCWQT